MFNMSLGKGPALIILQTQGDIQNFEAKGGNKGML